MTYKDKYHYWLNSDIIDEEFKEELRSIKDEKDIEDRFYKDLEFGTGGLRGIIGAGNNRMNVYTVSKATQGLSHYINNNYDKNKCVAIAYDSRNKSVEFAKAAALTLCANNIKVYLFNDLRPTPMLSFTVRHLNCRAGIVITASHNPKEYNGYKVYGDDGGQITDASAKEILSYINKIEDFSIIKTISEKEALDKNLLEYIGEHIDKAYIEEVKSLTIREEIVKTSSQNLKIIYTPIHGSGNIPVRRVLGELGYKNLHVVKEQELPNGNFPTAPYPNPEEPNVFKLALAMAKDIQPDLIFGTDPDCDRIGVVVKDSFNEYRVLTGNETGMLLTHYMITSLRERNKLPENSVIIKTIVTSDGVKQICEENNVEVIEVLTGFKYIGEKIKEYEKNKEKSFVFGFEESYGYLAGDFVRDKDAVIASMLICEMALYYKFLGKTLYDALKEIYEGYGYFKEKLLSLELPGKDGQDKISRCIETLRNSNLKEINKVNIKNKLDYKLGINKNIITEREENIFLPKSNVLKFILEDGSWVVIRPSGTEPKMKIYLSVKGMDEKEAELKTEVLKNHMMSLVNEIIK